jgi:hypothetical protein
MPHIRTQIRHALRSALTGLATTQDRVHVNRSARLSERQLPALVVTIDSEPVSFDGLDPVVRRELEITLDGYASADLADLDDQLDQVGLEVEVAMSAAGLLGGLVKAEPELRRTEIGIDESFEKPVGRIRMIFTTITYTAAGEPDAVI